MTEEAVPDVTNVQLLVDKTDLLDVVYHELSAERTPEAEDDSFELRVLVRRAENEIGVRCRVDVAGGGGTYVADGEAIFSVSEDLNPESEVLKEFAERVGVMVIYPYLRVAITESAAKLALKRPVLELIRAGKFELGSADSDDESDD